MFKRNNPSPKLHGHDCVTTMDGLPVSLTATVHRLEDINQATAPETHGIGLFDSNFIFKNRSALPGEEEQFEIYQKTVSRAGNRPVTIRTCNLRAGELPGSKIQTVGENPDLGIKGVRLGLKNPELMITQLRAMARANHDGHIHLLLPMVSTTMEIKQIKKMLNNIYIDLKAEGLNYRPITEVGIMADIPSVVVNAALFSFDAAFFQIGDALRNYTMAVDFAPGVLPRLKHQFEPSFFLQIQSLTAIATKGNKPTSISASIAAVPEAIPILLATGIQDFIMHPRDMEQVKKIITNITTHKAKVIASKAISFLSGEEVLDYAGKSLRKHLDSIK